MTESLAYPTDYLTLLQDTASGFLQRHAAEHLGEQELFTRAVNYLLETMQCNKAIAENQVARAYGELRSTDPRYLDVSSSTGKVAMLVDPRNGLHYAVPVSLILQMLIDNPARRRLSAVSLTTH